MTAMTCAIAILAVGLGIQVLNFFAMRKTFRVQNKINDLTHRRLDYLERLDRNSPKEG